MRLLSNPRRTLVISLVVVIVVNAVSLAARLLALGGHVPDPAVRLLSVDDEANLPTAVNGALLLASVWALACVAISTRRAGDRRWRSWALLCAVFAYLAIDELVTIHEAGIGFMERFVERSGAFTFGWWVLAVPLVLAFAVVNLPFLRGLPPRTRWLMITAGALYVAGAIGFEIVSGIVAEGRSPDLPSATDPLPYVLATQVEELLEMVAVSLFLYVVSSHARAAAPRGADTGCSALTDRR